MFDYNLPKKNIHSKPNQLSNKFFLYQVVARAQKVQSFFFGFFVGWKTEIGGRNFGSLVGYVIYG